MADPETPATDPSGSSGSSGSSIPPAAKVPPATYVPLVPISWFLGVETIHKLRDIALNYLSHDFNVRDWMDPGSPVDLRTGRSQIWFDYIADIGDGGAAMTALVYQMQHASLRLADLEPGRVGADARGLAPELPAGAFLFIGGDFAYPASDRDTLETRVIEPFRAARERLGADAIAPRPVYGIPGNHDYYAYLHGFNCVIRTHDPPDPPFQIPGHHAAQAASYVKLRLPHDWELWGLDLGKNGIDFRQGRYFTRPDEHGRTLPRRMILCTPNPPIVFGKSAPDEEHRCALQDKLELRADFEALAAGDPQDRSGGAPARHDLECRLDLAGDTHHYARYGHVDAVHDAVPAHSFASVVSGGGSAFLHPTHTSIGPIPPRRLYPAAWQSRVRVTERLVSLWRMLRAGQAWAFAALLTIGVYRGAFVADFEGVAAGLGWLLHVIAGGPAPARVPSPLASLAAAGSIVSFVVGLLLLLRLRLYVKMRSSRKRREQSRGPAAAPPAPPAYGEPDRTQPVLSRGSIYRSYWRGLVWVTAQLFVISGGLWACAQLWWPEASLAGALAMLSTLFWFGAGVALARVGIEYRRASSEPRLLGLGLVAGFMQATLPLAIMLYATWPAIGMIVALWVACWLIVRALEWRRATLAARREPPARGDEVQRVYTNRWLDLAITLLWLVRYAAAMYLLAHFAASRAPLFHGLSVGSVITCGVLGVVMCAHELGWYFLVAMLWNGHNNEAGASARLEDFKQWIRFHIGEDGVLTGYVIGIDSPRDVFACKPRLVDVFQVRPKPPGPS
ncbi:MAG TPA: hypothetical protein VNO30_37015 [Kofleriaceae bacterium]|nr:hypothetical protein [Kofleriaceae bacterium]